MKTSREDISRREVLKLGAVAVGAATLPAACAPDDPLTFSPPIDASQYDGGSEVDDLFTGATEDTTRFDLGVQAGSMQTGSALLWTHVTSDEVVTLRVWRPGATAGRVVLAFEGDAAPNSGGFTLRRAVGLAPGTEYFYAFFAGDGRRSSVGRVVTPPPAGHLAPVTVGAMTCTNARTQPWIACEHIATQRLDLLLHLGDMSYNDGAVTLDDYRAKWRATLGDPGYRAVLPTAGMYATWDDHEISNDLNPETIAPGLIATAKRAYFEALPQERNPDGHLWKSYRWGDSVEFFVLDCRTERVPSSREGDDATYISPEQMQWFKDALISSPCHFKVVLNSVPVTGFTSDFWALAGDRWQGYEAQRDEVLDFITDNDVRNVWFLAGDFHLGFVTRLEPEAPRRNMWEIAVGPTGNLGNPLALLVDDPEVGEDIFPRSMFRYARGALCATYLTFDPLRDTVRVRFVNGETDEVLYDEHLRWGI
jgi:phosphodiesterase/alkaline phosphatase D-like protein